jgi:hypothetical protein
MGENNTANETPAGADEQHAFRVKVAGAAILDILSMPGTDNGMSNYVVRNIVMGSKGLPLHLSEQLGLRPGTNPLRMVSDKAFDEAFEGLVAAQQIEPVAGGNHFKITESARAAHLASFPPAPARVPESDKVFTDFSVALGNVVGQDSPTYQAVMDEFRKLRGAGKGI